MIRRILWVEGLGSPAAVRRSDGTLFVDRKRFHALPPEQRVFVLFHELGHATLNTSDEGAADAFASQVYLDRGHSPRQSVLALTALARDGKWARGDHALRAENQLKRALQREGKDMSVIENFHRDHTMDYLTGKEFRAQKREAKIAKKNAQANRINAQAELKLGKAQGIAQGTFGGGAKEIIGKVVETAGGIAGGLLGAAPQNRVSGSLEIDAGGGQEEPKKNNTMLYIGIAVAILVVIVVVVVVLGKKKGKK